MMIFIRALKIATFVFSATAITACGGGGGDGGGDVGGNVSGNELPPSTTLNVLFVNMSDQYLTGVFYYDKTVSGEFSHEPFGGNLIPTETVEFSLDITGNCDDYSVSDMGVTNFFPVYNLFNGSTYIDTGTTDIIVFHCSRDQPVLTVTCMLSIDTESLTGYAMSCSDLI